MSTIVSRGIERRALWPAPARMSRMVSERGAPHPLAGQSRACAGRASEPSTRMLLADVAADCVIGVDLGGSKVLAGAVDAEQQVHHRAQRTVIGLEQAPLLDAVVDAVDEARAAAPTNPEVVGFGIPSLIDQEHGTAVMSVNLPIVDMPFRDVMSERLALPVFLDHDAHVAALAEHPYG